MGAPRPGLDLFQVASIEREPTDDPGYSRKRAARVFMLSTRSEREASIEQVPSEFRALVKHNLYLMLADELATVSDRDQAAALIDRVPSDLVDMVKAKARSIIQSRRVRFRGGPD